MKEPTFMLKHYVKSWYQTQSTERRREIKRAYVETFDVSGDAFVAAVKHVNPSLKKLSFWAAIFGCTINDLLKPPPDKQKRSKALAARKQQLEAFYESA